MSHPLPVRLKHAWAVFSGKIILPAQTEGLEFMTLLTKTDAAIAALSVGAAALIAANEGNAVALTQAQTDLANVDDTVSAALQPVVDQLTAAAPAPVVDDTATADSAVAGDAAPSGDTAADAAPAV
jgi:hypothetical protein